MPDPRIEALTNLYQINPSLFQPDELNLLQRELGSNNLDFYPQVAPEEQDLWDTSIGAVTKLFNGFVTGFTTIPVGEAPKNTTEAIFENIGHLLGFIGYVPGLGSIAKAGSMGLGRIIGGTMLKGGASLGKTAKVVSGIQKVAQHASVPMAGANLIMKGLGKSSMLRGAGAKTSEFLLKRGLSENVVRSLGYMGEGAAHLGFASAIGSNAPWELAVDERLDALMGGAIAGGVFRGLGVMFPNANGNLPNKDLFRNIINSAKDPKGSIRLVSSAIAMGLPTTMADAPVEMQIYQYLTGLVFGAGEMSHNQRRWLRDYHTAAQKKYNKPLTGYQNEILMKNVKENFPEVWESWPKEVKDIHAEQMKILNYRSSNEMYQFMALGQQDAIKKQKEALLDEYNAGTITIEQFRERLSRYNRIEMGEELSKALEQRVEDAVLKDLANDKIDKSINRGQLELMHSERIHDQMLKEVDKIANEQVKVELAKDAIDERLDRLGKFKDVKDFKQWAVEYALDEKELITPLVDPGRRFVYEMTKDKDFKLDVLRDKVKGTYDAISEAVKKKEPFPKLMERLEKLYEEPINREKSHEAIEALTKAYNRAKLEIVHDMVLDRAGRKIVSSKDFGGEYSDGSGAFSFKAKTQIQEQLEKAGYKDVRIETLKRVMKGNRHEELLDSDITYKEIEDIARENGYSVFGGVKDTRKLVLVKHLFNENLTPESVIERFAKDPERAKNFEELLKAKDFQTEKEYNDFAKDFANNILVAEALNESPIEAWFGKKGFINSAKNLNKRMSLLMNGFTRMEPEFFTTLDKGNVRTVILNVINKGDKEQVPGKTITYKALDKETKAIVDLVENTHLDGAFLIRSKTFDEMGYNAGAEQNISGLKGTLMHADKSGGLYGKYLYHRATPELDKWLTDNNIHSLLFTDSVKQLGDRKTSDWQWNKGKLDIEDMTVYDLPIKSFTVIEAGEHRAQMGKILENGKVRGRDPVIPIQMLSVLDERFGATKKWLTQRIRESYKGDQSENDKANAFLSNRLGMEEAKSIDIDKLGLQTKLRVLFKGEDNVLFRRLIDDVLKTGELEAQESMVIDMQAYLSSRMEVATGTAQRLIELGHTSPAELHSTLIQPYYMKALSSAVIKQVTRPKNESGWISKLHPLFGEVLEKHDIKPGTTVVPKELADKKLIPWIGNTEVTISEALKQYKKSPTPEMESFLEVGVQRVPTDAASGIRILRIIGTVDIPGSAMWVHPRDMKYSGGADLDGDAAFIIPRMPREVKAEFKKVKDEFHDKNDIFTDAKPDNSPFRAPVDDRMKKMLDNPASMFDGEVMSFINESAASASRGLGGGINAAKRMNGLFDLSSDKLGILKRKKDRTDLKRVRREFVNLSADASEGSKLVDIETVRDIFMRSAFTKKSLEDYREFVKLHKKMGEIYAKTRQWGLDEKETKRYRELEAEGAKTAYNTIKAITMLDNVVSGLAYNQGRSYKLGLDEIVDRAVAAKPFFGKKRVNDAGQEYYDEGTTNPYYFSALTIARLGEGKDGRVIDNIKEGGWMKQSAPSKMNEMTNFINRTERGKQLRDLVKRMAVKIHNPIESKPEDDATTLAYKMEYNEKLSQDGLDGAFWPLLNHYIKKLYPEKVNKEHIESIRNHAELMRDARALFMIAKKDKRLDIMDMIKKKWDELYKQDKIDKVLKLDISDSISKANRAIDHYIRLWKTGRTEAEKDLYDVFMLNPYREQEVTLKEFTEWGLKNVPGATEAKLKKTWNETDAHSKPWESSEISDNVISRYMDIYKEMMQRQPIQKVDAKTRELINELVESNVVDHDMEMGMSLNEFIVSNWNMRTRKHMDELRKELGDKKGNEVEETLRRQVREFLEKFPEFTYEVHGFTEGILITRNGELMESAPAIETATPAQLVYVGNVLESITKGHANPRGIKKTDYFFRQLSSIGREMVKWDPRTFKSRVPVMFTDKEGKVHVREKEVIMLTSTLGNIGKAWHIGDIKKDALDSRDKYNYMNSDIYKAVMTLNESHKGLGDKLYQLAIVNKQLRGELIRVNMKGQSPFPNIYVERFNGIKDLYNEAYNSKEKIYIPHLKKSITRREIMEMIDEWTTDVLTDYQIKLHNPEAERWFEARYNNSIELGSKSGKTGMLYDKEEYPILENWFKAFRHYNLQGKGENLGINVLKKMLFWSMLDKNSRVWPKNAIEDVIRDGRNRRFFDRDQRTEFLRNGGKFETIEDMLNSSLYQSIRANENALADTPEAFFARKAIREGVRDHNGFLLKDYSQYRNHFYRRWGYTPRYYEENLQQEGFSRNWTENYFPQTDHDPKVVKEHQRQRILEAQKRDENIAQILDEHIDRLNASRSTSEEAGMERVYNEIMSDTPVSMNQMRSIISRFGSAEKRSPDDPTPGWAIDLDVPIRYAEKLNKLYYKFVSNFISEFSLRELENDPRIDVRRDANGKSTTVWGNWIDFASIYNRNQMGMASYYPKPMLENKELKLKNNPYYYFTDQAYDAFYKKTADKWFGGKSLFAKTAQMITREQWDAMTQRERERIQQMLKADFGRLTNRFSQLEAKWNFLSLLTHTKTFIANLLGGNLLTYANVGMHPFLKANNFDYLARNHFFEAKNMGEVLRWTEQHGAIDSMFKMELGLQGAFKAGKFSDAGKEILRYLHRNKYDEKSLKTIAKKNNISDALFNSAAWFMRKSEVMLRSRSFLAHLIKHKESLNMWGMDMPNDHPWLIELANRGVQATQFLYNNANRPMFAQTSLGKIYSRFQLWTWNSIKFRRDLIRQANEFGWAPNSIEFDRLKRIMTADMFMLGLATMFPASLFENSLAPPLTYVQDLSDFFFGDDEKRERAFYGVLPFPANILQPLSPPSTRVVYQTIQLMATGDWDSFGNRAWTWVPFGRLGQSTYRTIKSPITAVNNYTSFPLTRVHKLMTKEEDKKERHNPGISIIDIFK